MAAPGFTFGGLDFFLTFWLGSVVIYLVKIFIVLRLIAGSGWTPADRPGDVKVIWLRGTVVITLYLHPARR